MNEITLVGHRGLMARYPENTLVSLRAALEAGADWVEFDLQVSADGEFLLMHDASLQRTTGEAGLVFDCSSEHLTSLSAGYAKKFSEAFCSERIPTLIEALNLVSDYPQARALVEIKSESLFRFGHQTVMEGLLQILQLHRQKLRLISFDAAAIAYANRTGELECGWVMNHVDEVSMALAETLKPVMLACDYRDIPAWMPVDQQFEWMVYDVKQAAIARDMVQRGIAMIETADVEQLIKDLPQERQHG